MCSHTFSSINFRVCLVRQTSLIYFFCVGESFSLTWTFCCSFKRNTLCFSVSALTLLASQCSECSYLIFELLSFLLGWNLSDGSSQLVPSFLWLVSHLVFVQHVAKETFLKICLSQRHCLKQCSTSVKNVNWLFISKYCMIFSWRASLWLFSLGRRHCSLDCAILHVMENVMYDVLIHVWMFMVNNNSGGKMLDLTWDRCNMHC